MNEIKEEEEEDKPQKIQKKEESHQNREKAEEGDSHKTPEPNSKHLQVSKNNLSESDQKRENFRLKGRGKSEILPNRRKEDNNYAFPTIKITEPQEEIFDDLIRSDRSNPHRENSKSPRFFIKTENPKKKKKDIFSSFSELTKNYGKRDTLSVHLDKKHHKIGRVGSLRSLDQSNENPDFKQQELMRRQKIASYSVSADHEPEEVDLFDLEYYQFLKRIEILKKKNERSNAEFLHRRGDKESPGKDFYKMIRNLRFKIHYNHFFTNIRFNFNEEEEFEEQGGQDSEISSDAE